MMARFKSGAAVEFVAATRHGRTGVFEIIRELPRDDFDPRYRVKSTVDGHERVAHDYELQSVSSDARKPASR